MRRGFALLLSALLAGVGVLVVAQPAQAVGSPLLLMHRCNFDAVKRVGIDIHFVRESTNGVQQINWIRYNALPQSFRADRVEFRVWNATDKSWRLKFALGGPSSTPEDVPVHLDREYGDIRFKDNIFKSQFTVFTNDGSAVCRSESPTLTVDDNPDFPG